jgi:benzoyl-CoA reductase/2-hydroxyglutaryl-CoA dehydratase subunit BcrC/BadD/HgdB
MKPTGDIDGACEGKNTWDDAVRTFVPRIMDISAIEWEHHKPKSVQKLREALESEFEFVGGELTRQDFRNAIKRYLKGERSRLKAKNLTGHSDCPVHVQPMQWETLKEYWTTDK